MNKKLDRTVMSEEIKRAIISFSDEDVPQLNEILNDEPILELGILDSPGVLNLVIWYEEHFSIKVSDNEFNINNFGTISKMIAFVFKKKGLC